MYPIPYHHIRNMTRNEATEAQTDENTNTLIINADEIVRAYIENLRQSDSRNVEMRVRWQKEWTGEQHANVDWYDTSLYTRQHHRVKPSSFIGSTRAYIPDKSQLMRNYADEHDIDASHPDEIRDQADDEELEAWIDQAWNVFENQIRGAVIEDADRLKKFAPELEDVDVIRFE